MVKKTLIIIDEEVKRFLDKYKLKNLTYNDVLKLLISNIDSKSLEQTLKILRRKGRKPKQII
jgi:hypothetical protein